MNPERSQNGYIYTKNIQTLGNLTPLIPITVNHITLQWIKGA